MDTTILIVDDSPYIVDGLVALLKRRGFSPLACSSGEEAIALLSAQTPDLILLDIMMEPMDGWETLAKIKADKRTCDIPVLMFSAKKITPEEAEEHSMSIEDFVSKPVNPAQLLEAINQVFLRRTAVRTEMERAMERGVDPQVIEEFSVLRKSIGVDKNLLAVLKKSSGVHIPGKEIPDDDLAAIQRLEEKIRTGEQRLREISSQFVPPL